VAGLNLSGNCQIVNGKHLKSQTFLDYWGDFGPRAVFFCRYWRFPARRRGLLACGKLAPRTKARREAGMKIRHFGIAAALILGTGAAAQVQARNKDNRLGAGAWCLK
jgi:hypothetical protein